jgi:hypothetical protein
MLLHQYKLTQYDSVYACRQLLTSVCVAALPPAASALARLRCRLRPTKLAPCTMLCTILTACTGREVMRLWMRKLAGLCFLLSPLLLTLLLVSLAWLLVLPVTGAAVIAGTASLCRYIPVDSVSQYTQPLEVVTQRYKTALLKKKSYYTSLNSRQFSAQRAVDSH